MSGITEVNHLAAASIGADAATTDTIASAFGLIHVLQVYTSAMMAVAVWDWILCLKVEYQVIWKSSWSVVKFLYLWTRYYGLLAFSLNLWLFNDNFTVERCKTLHWIIAASCMWVTLGSEAILAVRTWAFLGRRRLTGIILGTLVLGETAFLLYVSIAGVHQTVLPVVTRGPCTASDAPGRHVVSGYWLAPVAFDLLCTILMLWKVAMLKMNGLSRLVKLFVSEGVFYFLLVAGVNVLNAIFMFQPSANLQNINCFLALILTQVLCCRLVLNLRANASSAMMTQGPSHANSTMKGSGPVFARPRADPEQTAGTVSIALNNFDDASKAPQHEWDNSSFEHGGVKVHVAVDHDVDGRR